MNFYHHFQNIQQWTQTFNEIWSDAECRCRYNIVHSTDFKGSDEELREVFDYLDKVPALFFLFREAMLTVLAGEKQWLQDQTEDKLVQLLLARRRRVFSSFFLSLFCEGILGNFLHFSELM